MAVCPAFLSEGIQPGPQVYQSLGFNRKPSVLDGFSRQTEPTGSTYIKRDLFKEIGARSCGSWLTFAGQAGRLETQIGADIAVLTLKAGNAKGISLLPCGGGFCPLWRSSADQTRPTHMLVDNLLSSKSSDFNVNPI